MEVFVAVVDMGTFSAAAQSLNLSAVMVGKTVHQLEDHLKARLLNRTTRRQNLTDAGTAFYKAARDILAQVKVAEDSIENMQATPQGLLRVSAPDTLGSAAIAPLLASYSLQHPGVHVELVLSNERVNLIEERFDLAVRIGPLADTHLVARPLKPYQMVICASPEYLARTGVPLTMGDLDSHHCLGHLAFGVRNAWHVGEVEYVWPQKTTLTTNDGHALRAAAIAGAGVIIQPEVLLANDIQRGLLVRILDPYLPPPRPVNLVYLRDSKPRRKLMSLVQWILRDHALQRVAIADSTHGIHDASSPV
jgi:DNA-binding transcriptional LysR family regulator